MNTKIYEILVEVLNRIVDDLQLKPDYLGQYKYVANKPEKIYNKILFLATKELNQNKSLIEKIKKEGFTKEQILDLLYEYLLRAVEEKVLSNNQTIYHLNIFLDVPNIVGLFLTQKNIAPRQEDLDYISSLKKLDSSFFTEIEDINKFLIEIDNKIKSVEAYNNLLSFIVNSHFKLINSLFRVLNALDEGLLIKYRGIINNVKLRIKFNINELDRIFDSLSDSYYKTVNGLGAITNEFFRRIRGFLKKESPKSVYTYEPLTLGSFKEVNIKVDLDEFLQNFRNFVKNKHPQLLRIMDRMERDLKQQYGSYVQNVEVLRRYVYNIINEEKERLEEAGVMLEVEDFLNELANLTGKRIISSLLAIEKTAEVALLEKEDLTLSTTLDDKIVTMLEQIEDLNDVLLNILKTFKEYCEEINKEIILKESKLHLVPLAKKAIENKEDMDKIEKTFPLHLLYKIKAVVYKTVEDLKKRGIDFEAVSQTMLTTIIQIYVKLDNELKFSLFALGERLITRVIQKFKVQLQRQFFRDYSKILEVFEARNILSKSKNIIQRKISELMNKHNLNYIALKQYTEFSLFYLYREKIKFSEAELNNLLIRIEDYLNQSKLSYDKIHQIIENFLEEAKIQTPSKWIIEVPTSSVLPDKFNKIYNFLQQLNKSKKIDLQAIDPEGLLDEVSNILKQPDYGTFFDSLDKDDKETTILNLQSIMREINKFLKDYFDKADIDNQKKSNIDSLLKILFNLEDSLGKIASTNPSWSAVEKIFTSYIDNLYNVYKLNEPVIPDLEKEKKLLIMQEINNSVNKNLILNYLDKFEKYYLNALKYLSKHPKTDPKADFIDFFVKEVESLGLSVRDLDTAASDIIRGKISSLNFPKKDYYSDLYKLSTQEIEEIIAAAYLYTYLSKFVMPDIVSKAKVRVNLDTDFFVGLKDFHKFMPDRIEYPLLRALFENAAAMNELENYYKLKEKTPKKSGETENDYFIRVFESSVKNKQYSEIKKLFQKKYKDVIIEISLRFPTFNDFVNYILNEKSKFVKTVSLKEIIKKISKIDEKELENLIMQEIENLTDNLIIEIEPYVEEMFENLNNVISVISEFMESLKEEEKGEMFAPNLQEGLTVSAYLSPTYNFYKNYDLSNRQLLVDDKNSLLKYSKKFNPGDEVIVVDNGIEFKGTIASMVDPLTYKVYVNGQEKEVLINKIKSIRR